MKPATHGGTHAWGHAGSRPVFWRQTRRDIAETLPRSYRRACLVCSQAVMAREQLAMAEREMAQRRAAEQQQAEHAAALKAKREADARAMREAERHRAESEEKARKAAARQAKREMKLQSQAHAQLQLQKEAHRRRLAESQRRADEHSRLESQRQADETKAHVDSAVVRRLQLEDQARTASALDASPIRPAHTSTTENTADASPAITGARGSPLDLPTRAPLALMARVCVFRRAPPSRTRRTPRGRRGRRRRATTRPHGCTSKRSTSA